MPRFDGFPSGRLNTTPLPEPFFSQILPELDDLGELKVILYAFWFLNQLESDVRYFTLEDISSDERFLSGWGERTTARPAVKAAVTRAVERGVFIQANTLTPQGKMDIFFINGPRGRAALRALEQNAWTADPAGRPVIHLDMLRPNIFELYEQHIGPLTPLIADRLREAETEYPGDWIEDAVEVAVVRNTRRWDYVEGILRSWKEKGRDENNRRYS